MAHSHYKGYQLTNEDDSITIANAAGSQDAVALNQLTSAISAVDLATVLGNGNTVGGHSILWGNDSMFSDGTYHNLAWGQSAGTNFVASAGPSFSDNIALGELALNVLAAGVGNYAMGSQALNTLTAGNGNTALGSSVGGLLSSGDNNTIIGYNIEFTNATGSNQLNLKNAIYGIGMDGTGNFDSTGNIGLFVQAPTARLHLPAGSVTGGQAPMKIDDGTVMTTPEANAIENDGIRLYYTNSLGNRDGIALLSDITGGTPQYEIPMSGDTIIISPATNILTINPAGTIATLTIDFPATPTDGQTIRFSTTQIITSLTLTGGLFYGALITLGAEGFASYAFSTGDSYWHRIG